MNNITQEELNRLIKKYDLQYYDKKNLLERIHFLIARYSQDMFSLDVSKVEELDLIAKTIESVTINRTTNWTLRGKTSEPYDYCIDHRGAIVKFRLHSVRNFGNQDPIRTLNCLVQSSVESFQQFKDAEVILTGDLIMSAVEVIVDVKTIKKIADHKK